MQLINFNLYHTYVKELYHKAKGKLEVSKTNDYKTAVSLLNKQS